MLVRNPREEKPPQSEYIKMLALSLKTKYRESSLLKDRVIILTVTTIKCFYICVGAGIKVRKESKMCTLVIDVYICVFLKM